MGDLGSIPGLGRSPRRRERLPIPVFWPGKFHGWRSLEGYRPWGQKESDTTERLSLHLIQNFLRDLNSSGHLDRSFLAQGQSSPGQDRKLDKLCPWEHELLLQRKSTILPNPAWAQPEQRKAAWPEPLGRADGFSHLLLQGTSESKGIETCPLISHGINQPSERMLGPEPSQVASPCKFSKSSTNKTSPPGFCWSFC